MRLSKVLSRGLNGRVRVLCLGRDFDSGKARLCYICNMPEGIVLVTIPTLIGRMLQPSCGPSPTDIQPSRNPMEIKQ